VDRAAWRVAVKEKKKKKDAEKAWARERMRAQDALEKLCRRQEREGLSREPSPETPDDDDDDEDDDEDDDMAARLGFSPGLKLGQEPSSQPPSGLASSDPGVGTPRSRPEERGQTERALDPSVEGVEVTPGNQVEASVPREPSGRRGSVWAVRLPGVQGAQSKGGAEAAGEADLDGAFGGRDSRDLPSGMVDHGPERVSILERLRPGFSFLCPDRDLSFLLSKRSHGLTDLAPQKALKTASATCCY
jgi:hypothetical protein